MSEKVCLVVDDEASVRQFITTVLRSDGFQTLEAENGVQALELLRKLDGAVDLLVSDIQMPNMDGITLACSVRAQFPAIPLILVSGYADAERNSLSSGVHFVQKPFVKATLLDAVKNVVSKRSERSGGTQAATGT